MNDREIVERQLGRPPRAFRRVAVRCPFGLPAVTEQAPFDAARTPFPTQFWLTCPHLATQLARLEAAGGVVEGPGSVDSCMACLVGFRSGYLGSACAQPGHRTGAEKLLF